MIDFARGAANWFAQKMFGPETEQAVEHNDFGGTCFCTSRDERKHVPPKIA